MCPGEGGGVCGRGTGQSLGKRWVCHWDSFQEAPSRTVAVLSPRHSVSTSDACRNRFEFPAGSIVWFSENKNK